MAMKPGAVGRLLFVLCLLYLILYIDRANISTTAPLIRKELGLDNTQFGFAASAFAYPYAFFQLVGGWLGDRFGPRRVLLISGLVVIASTAATGMVGGLATLIAARFALGLGEGATFPTATRAMAAWIPKAYWGFAQGITHSAARLGNAVTPLLIAGMLNFGSWRDTFFIFAAFNLLWLVPWFLMTRATSAQMTAQGSRIDARTWFALARRMLPVTAVDFCYGWTLWVFLTWIPSFFTESLHLDLKNSALSTAAVLTAGVLGDLAGGVVSDWRLQRTGDLTAARRDVIIVGFLGAFIAMLPVVLIHDLTIDTIGLSVACFCAELIVGPIWSAPMDIAPRRAGTASGMMNLGFGIAGIISPPCFGYMIDLTGSWVWSFSVSMALLLVGVGTSFRMRAGEAFHEPS